MIARSTITREGLIIDGQPFYLLAGSVHYFRWPRGEWRNILLKANRIEEGVCHV